MYERDILGEIISWTMMGALFAVYILVKIGAFSPNRQAIPFELVDHHTQPADYADR